MIQEVDASGEKRIRFQPVPAYETAISMEVMCRAYREAVENQKAEMLLIDFTFILDFLCIHPFNDGNGRISRLLTLLLLYRHGYMVGKYVSLESLIEKTKDSYYLALEQSSANWHEGANDIWPFVKYMLGILLAAYREFETRIMVVSEAKLTKEERIRGFVADTIGLFTKSDIVNACPDISPTTVEKVLGQMRREDRIRTVGSGRGTKWCKIEK